MNGDIEKLLRDRYLLPEETGWEDLCKRLESLYKPMYEYMKDMTFIYSTPTLMNFCKNGERLGTLSSCFPMDVRDSIEDITDAIKEASLVTKFGGGIGYDFSKLRASCETITTLGAKSSGPVTFIEGFNAVLDMIRQGGKRRGAGMAMLDITHPDILEFITVKADRNKLSRFNLSVRVPDSFYKKLKKDPNLPHIVKAVVSGEEFELKDSDGKTITVGQLWDQIMTQAWENGEPGIFNSDIAFRQCTVTNLNPHVLANPCSEFANIPNTSCSLASTNLSHLVEGTKFNWAKYRDITSHGVRAQNNVIDMNRYPIKAIKDITLKTRPIGLGYMGLAHALFKMGIPYNSKEAIKFTENVTRFMTVKAMCASVELAKETGKSYEAFDYDLFMLANERFFKYKTCRGIDMEKLAKRIKRYGIRNSAFTAIAPTGTISTLSECSSGIEPVFALTYMRKVEVGNKEYEIMYITDPVFKAYLDENFDEVKQAKILKEISENKGSCQKCKDIPIKFKKLFVVAGDLTPTEHLDILEAAAKNTSMSVSKTINLPEDVKKSVLSDVFIDAHSRGIIGVTVYRQGSREGILLTENGEENKIIEQDAPTRPKSLPCHVYKIKVKGDQWIVFVGLFNDHPYEVFAGKVDLVDLPSSIKEGFITKVKSSVYRFEHEGEVIIKDIGRIFESAEQEALTRMISTNLRHGTPVEFVNDQLSKSNGTIVDFNKAILRALKSYMKELKLSKSCPSCGCDIVMKEGCQTCIHCGWSKCA